MSNLTNKKLGNNDISQYVLSSSNTVKVNKNTGGWNFKGTSTSYAELSLMDMESVTQRQFSSLQCLISLQDITYSNIPYVSIKLQPTGTGDYSPGNFHAELRYKIADNNLYIKNNEFIMFLDRFRPNDHQDSTNASHPLVLYETLGTDDHRINIKSIKVVAPSVNSFDYTILNSSYHHSGLTGRIEVITYSNFDISDAVRQLELSTKVLENRTKYNSTRGQSQVVLGTTGETVLVADSTIKAKVDSNMRDGWYFENKVAGSKYNLYKFGGSAEVIRYSHIKTIYSRLYIDGPSMPFFHIYTKPLGDGTDHEFWYNSKWTYFFNFSNFTGVGVENVLFASVNSPVTNIDFNVQQYRNTGELIDGPGTDGDILYIAMGTDTSDSVSTVKHCINLLGFNADDGFGTITEKNFSLTSRVGNNISRSSYNHVSNETVDSNLVIGGVIDLESLKTINIVGFATGNHSIDVLHSTDGLVYYFDSTHSPVQIGTTYHYNIKIQDELRFIKLYNTNTVNTFTLQYSIF